MNLYQLLAQNRISPRRAAILSYISSLLLHTLPQIDADKAAGITDPTKSIPINASVPDEDTDEDDEDFSPDPNGIADSETETETETETDSETAPQAHLDSTDAWDHSIPEPDPKKKPS